jgi:hypothetical protein
MVSTDLKSLVKEEISSVVRKRTTDRYDAWSVVDEMSDTVSGPKCDGFPLRMKMSWTASRAKYKKFVVLFLW